MDDDMVPSLMLMGMIMSEDITEFSPDSYESELAKELILSCIFPDTPYRVFDGPFVNPGVAEYLETCDYLRTSSTH